MPKILVDDYNKGVRKFPKDIEIYPVDYDYCVDYIMDNVEMKKDKYYWYYFCYTCGDTIENMENISDFEITVLSCGHLHHTSCLLSHDSYNLNAIVEKCVYCNSNAGLDVIKKTIEKTYYGCILAYDMKNPDYISKFSDFSQKCHTQGKFKTKDIDEFETINITIKVKEGNTNPVLRRSARIMKRKKCYSASKIDSFENQARN